MSLVPFLVACFAGAALSLFAGPWTRLSAAVGIGALVAALAASLAIRPNDVLAIGDGAIVGSAYVRLFGALGAIGGLLVSVAALAAGWHRSVPGASLAIVGAGTLALAATDPIVGVLVIVTGGLAGVPAALAQPATLRGLGIAATELRAAVVAGSLALVAAAWTGRFAGASGALDGGSGPPIDAPVVLGLEPGAVGLAFLAFAAAVAVRFGVIPLHGRVARLADAGPEATLPFVAAWGPAALALVALGWSASAVVPLEPAPSLERGLIVAVGGLTLLAGAFAAWIQDDVEHVVGYSIVQDAGFALLALGAVDPAAWGPARTWALGFVTARTAFAAWALALQGAYGTRWIADLGGWARRSPLLGLALVGVAVATIGWPGLLAWEVRSELVELAIDGPVAGLVALGAFASLAYYGRLIAVGLGRPTPIVLAAASPWPRWPLGIGGRHERPAPRPERPAPIHTAVARARVVVEGGLGSIEPLWRLNRTPIAAAIVLLLSATAWLVAAGAFGVAEAARADAPQVGAPGAPGSGGSVEPVPSAEPSFEPVPVP